MSGLSRPKAVLLDLDGTLYEDDVICYRLIDSFFADSPFQHLAQEVRTVMREVLEGREALKCGHFAPKQTALLGATARELFQVSSVAALPLDNPERYFDRSRYSYIGEGWSLAMYLGHRIGWYGDAFWERFRCARRDLLSEAYGPAVVPRTVLVLRELRRKGIRLILCTNSREEDAWDVLERHGLAGLFDACFFDAHKPWGFAPVLESMGKAHSFAPHELLFVGDQGYSDLYYGHRMGAQTLLVSRCFVDDGMDWTARAYSHNEMLDLLEAVALGG